MDLTGKIPENLQKVYISQGKEKEFLVDGLLKKKKSYLKLLNNNSTKI